MNDDARRFEHLLNDLENDQGAADFTTPDASVTVPGEHAIMRDGLRLVAALRAVQPPSAEVAAVREAVADLLREAMAPPPLESHSVDERNVAAFFTATPRRRTARTRRMPRLALAAAAVLLVACAAGWLITASASAALPGSPLYGLKRAEEQAALDTAWSDARRGAVLVLIADHRLSEMRAEAQRHDDTLVRSLAVDFDGAMRQLIALTSSMTQQHEDTSAVAAGLASELNAEYSTLNDAIRSGDVALVQTLTATTQTESIAISASNIRFPAGALAIPTPAATAPGATGTPRGGPPSLQGPGASPTHTPPVGPGNGKGNGSGGQGGNSSGNNGRGSHGGGRQSSDAPGAPGP